MVVIEREFTRHAWADWIRMTAPFGRVDFSGQCMNIYINANKEIAGVRIGL